MQRFKAIDFRAFRDRLLLHEKNRVTIPNEGLLSIALVFPNSYAVGMANLGFQTIYRLFNEFPGVRCERAFLYEQFPEQTRTLESGSELRNFDVVAFSISFELDFSNVVQILVNAGITPFAAKRHELEPIVMAGGAMAFLNPLPIAPFIDFFFLGEIESQCSALLQKLLQFKNNRISRHEILNCLARDAGIFVPESTPPGSEKVYQVSSERMPQYSPIISPDSHFRNMFLIEVGRGCGRHCSFCAASYIYHPMRIFSQDKILNTILKFNQDTKKVGLIGAALSDYPHLFQLSHELVAQGFELGLSSFRLDMITPSFLEILARGKVKSLTFAPEAGTERLRKLIHKNLSDDQIQEAVLALADSQITQLKLYFMIGLPGETDDDIEAIVQLVKVIQEIMSRRNKPYRLILSVNTFIPKPFTPFQWSAMATWSEIRRKRNYLEREFKKIGGVQFIKKSLKEEILQGIFSLGNTHIADGILFKIQHHVDWQTAWHQAGIDVESILYQPRNRDDELPWDFIKYRISKERLWKNWATAQKEPIP